jgi:hypothetical protein
VEYQIVAARISLLSETISMRLYGHTANFHTPNPHLVSAAAFNRAARTHLETEDSEDGVMSSETKFLAFIEIDLEDLLWTECSTGSICSRQMIGRLSPFPERNGLMQ